MKRQSLFLRLISVVGILGLLFSEGGTPVRAQGPQPPRLPTPPPPLSGTLHSTHDPLKDAQSTTGPVPPAGALLLAPAHTASAAAVTLAVPAYLWRHGCGPTAAGMVIGYWDAHGFPALIPGDATTQTTAVDEAIASSIVEQSHYTDYVLPMETGSEPAPLPDKSEPPAGDEHPSNSLGDFMHTSWSAVGNYYGWSWFSDVAPAFSGYIQYVNQTTGSHYTAVTQKYYMYDGSLSWDLLKNEINAGRPVIFLVDSSGDGYTDHFVAVRGYDESGGVLYYGANNTWDTNSEPHWYEFGPMQSGKPWGVYGAITLQVQDISSLDHSVFLPLVLGPSPYLMLQSFRVYDGYDYYSFGNRDSQPNPGETIALEVEIKNSGPGKALDVYADLSTSDSYVNAFPAYQGYEWMSTYLGDIAPGSSGYAAFRLLIHSNTPTGHVIPFHLSLMDGNGTTWAYDFSITVTGLDTTPPQVLSAYTWPQVITTSQPTLISAFVLEPGALKSVNAKVYKTTSSTPVATIALYDDGSHGDYMPGDRWFTNQYTPNTANDFYVDVTAIDNRNNSQTGMKMAGFTSKGFTPTHNKLLVIDQLSYNEVNGYYTGALSANGYAYDLWDGFFRGPLDTSVLSSYASGVVIYAMPTYGWLTDYDYSGVRDGLITYLDSGGRLFISGQDIGYYSNWLEDNRFYTDYLRASYSMDDTGLSRLNGVPEDPISNDLSLSITGGDGANNQLWPDGIVTLSPAVPVLFYDPLSIMPEAHFSEGNMPSAKARQSEDQTRGAVSITLAGALRVEESGHRVVYFSFGFEAINGAAGNSRADVMKRVIVWLNRQ